MSDFIQIIIHFLNSIIQFEPFLYLMGSIAVFGVILLIRKIVYV